jgi:hypothetical protein
MQKEYEQPQDGARGAARLTPYELAFGAAEWETRMFPSLEREAETAGIDPAQRDRFAFLTVGGDALRDVVPEEMPPEAAEEYRVLLYHAFNFWRFGKRAYLLDTALARYLVEAAPKLQGWEFALPYPSLYVQLPANLFWASISPESTPEPVDGFFATASHAEGPVAGPYQRLELLLVLGIRRERAGFSVIPFDTQVGPGIPAVWAETPGREAARDFENILPGGEISGLYSILTTAEALKLLARAIWYIAAHPLDVRPHEAPETRTGSQQETGRTSRLDFQRVTFGEGGA